MTAGSGDSVLWHAQEQMAKLIKVGKVGNIQGYAFGLKISAMWLPG